MELKDDYQVLGVERSGSADAIKKAYRHLARKHHPDLTLPVAPWEAALGAEVELLTPDGQVAMHVPAGSQTGRKLHLRGRGIPGRELTSGSRHEHL